MNDNNLEQPPVRIDNTEAYQNRGATSCPRLETADQLLASISTYTEDQQAILATEAAMFGIDPVEDPEGFVAAHTGLLDRLQTRNQEVLPRMKQEVIERVSNYFANGDASIKRGLEELISRRLAATTTIGIYDRLADSRSRGASFHEIDRQIYVNSWELVYTGTSAQDEAAHQDGVEKVAIAHELMHAMLTAGTQAHELNPHWPVRNGLAIDYHSNPMNFLENVRARHGVWLNEAILESFRRQIFETDDVRYEPGVMVLETLDELLPGLRDELLVCALDRSGPGPVFGKIEAVLGPLGIEKIEQLLAGGIKFTDLPRLKRDVISMMPSDIQQQASDVFSRKEHEIVGARPAYIAAMATLQAQKMGTMVVNQ